MLALVVAELKASLALASSQTPETSPPPRSPSGVTVTRRARARAGGARVKPALPKSNRTH